MQLRISASLLLSACVLVGCNKDDDNTTAPQAPATPPVLSTNARPTTEQLISEPRTALDVKYAPITLQVPPGWSVKSYNDVTVVTIEGTTPTDVVSISIPSYRVITDDQEKSLEAHAKQDFADHPELIEKLGVRDITGGKVIERLILDPIVQSTQPATTEPLQTMQWTYTLCVPSTDGKQFNAYDLRFLGMTLKQYKADQHFLRSVMDSLTYTPSDLLPK